ncbi:MAG: shikimate dehydrogenase [Sphingomicrobium sp.]
MTLHYAEVIGDPIVQSKSPLIHNFWLGKLGVEADYRATLVTSATLAGYLAQRRTDLAWRGCNVTMPLKLAVAPLVEHVDDFARRAGAINTVVFDGRQLRGGNSDGAGFLEPMANLEPGVAWLIGTGGAACAIALALGDAGFSVTVFGRSIERATALAVLAGGTAQLLDDLHPSGAVCLLVNASALGMTGQPPLDLSLGEWPRGTAVYDIVTSPVETQLLVEAKAHGMPTFDGLQMLVGQAAVAFERFFGQPAPREHDAELRRLLIS